jgi:hypothetical protein
MARATSGGLSHRVDEQHRGQRGLPHDFARHQDASVHRQTDTPTPAGRDRPPSRACVRWRASPSSAHLPLPPLRRLACWTLEPTRPTPISTIETTPPQEHEGWYSHTGIALLEDVYVAVGSPLVPQLAHMRLVSPSSPLATADATSSMTNSSDKICPACAASAVMICDPRKSSRCRNARPRSACHRRNRWVHCRSRPPLADRLQGRCDRGSRCHRP